MGASSRRARQAIVAALDEAHRKEIDAAEARGERRMLVNILTHLEKNYLDEATDMTSPKGKAITALARDLVTTFGIPVAEGETTE